jgi:phosphohistidine phosphatase SixA
MPLFLVRHAKAGSRSGWVGPDEARPLSKSGREQAESMKRELAERPVRRILSSTYVRCIETVQPLASKLGLAVEATDALAEGAHYAPVDIIPAVIDALQRRGMSLEGEPDYRKGATWVIERDGDEFVRATTLPPPA